MKIAISVETTSDLTKELLTKYDIRQVPFQINLADLSFKDGQYSTDEMFELVEKYGVLPKTNAINEYEYTEHFEELKKEYDEIVHIGLSSGITSSLGNAKRASANMQGVYVVDSKSLSTGIALLAIYGRELTEQGKSAQEIADILQARTEKLQASFVVERLDYLYKGGRCTGFQLLGANLLKLRPRIIVKDGGMLSDKKYKGSMGRVIKEYCKDILNEFNTPDLKRVFITYTSGSDEMLESANTALKDAGFNEIIETRAGGTIASHCGPNTLGVLYFNDGE